MQKPLSILIACVLLTACAPGVSPGSPSNSNTPGGNLQPIYAPRPGDDSLSRGEVIIDSTDLLAAESFPVQYFLAVKGSLPTPCHQIRAIVNAPDAKRKITIEIYSVADPQAVCVMMIQPFDLNLPLGSFPSGHYTVWVNGEQVAEIDA